MNVRTKGDIDSQTWKESGYTSSIRFRLNSFKSGFLDRLAFVHGLRVPCVLVTVSDAVTPAVTECRA
jgi:hypothetical protein